MKLFLSEFDFITAVLLKNFFEGTPYRLVNNYQPLLIIIIIIIIIINCNWVVTRWQLLFYIYTNMREVNRKFKSGGLHEKYVMKVT